MEKTFDDWNEKLRVALVEKQEKLAVNFQARKLQEYRDSVSELQVCFSCMVLGCPEHLVLVASPSRLQPWK